MKLTDDQIREITIKAINELGENANPESVRKYVEQEVKKLEFTISSEKDTGGGRVILTSFGVNHPGIVATITKTLSENQCDIMDISQKIMQEFYTMIMLIDISNSTKELRDLQNELNRLSEQLKVKIYLQHEDVFRYMHRI